MKLHVVSRCTFIVLVTAIFASSTFASEVSVIAAPATSQIKSFREWKGSLVQDSQQKISSIKEGLKKQRQSASAIGSDPNLKNKSQSEAGINQNLQNIQTLLEKEQNQLSNVQDLTIADYFVGYLIKQKSLDKAIKEVSMRLSADEVAELMTAYANNFFSTQPASVGASPRAGSGQ